MDTLPIELLVEILLKSDDKEMVNLYSTNNKLSGISATDLFWRERIYRLYPDKFSNFRGTSWKKFYLELTKAGIINILRYSDRPNIRPTITNTNFHDNGTIAEYDKYIFDDGAAYVKSMIVLKGLTDHALIRLTNDKRLFITDLTNGFEEQFDDILDIKDYKSGLFILKNDHTILIWRYLFGIKKNIIESYVTTDFVIRKIIGSIRPLCYIALVSTDGNIYKISDDTIEPIYDAEQYGKAIDAVIVRKYLLVITEKGQLNIIDMTNNTLEDHAISIRMSKIIAATEYIYLLAQDGAIIVLDAKKFSPIYIYKVDYFVSIECYGDTVYALAKNRKLYALKYNIQMAHASILIVDTDVINLNVTHISINYIKGAAYGLKT